MSFKEFIIAFVNADEKTQEQIKKLLNYNGSAETLKKDLQAAADYYKNLENNQK